MSRLKTLLMLLCLPATAPLAAAPADPLAPTGRWPGYEGGQAPLPPRGWNSWNAFHTDLDEAKVLGSAQRIVQSGLRPTAVATSTLTTAGGSSGGWQTAAS